MKKSQKIKFVVFTLAFLAFNTKALAVSDSRLWLPKKYITLQPRLKQIAELAAKREECVTVIRGELAFGRSKPGQPVFRIVCRNQQSLSFAIYSYLDESGVDKLDIKEPNKNIDPPIDEVIGRRLCYIAAKDKAANLIKPKVLINPDLKPYINDSQESVFYIDVNAESLSATPLQFGVICTIQPDSTYETELMSRSKMQALQAKNQTSVVKAESKQEANSKQPAEHKQEESIKSNVQSHIKSPSGIAIGKAKTQSVPPSPHIKSHVEVEITAEEAKDGWEVMPSNNNALNKINKNSIRTSDENLRPQSSNSKNSPVQSSTLQSEKMKRDVIEGWEVLDNTTKPPKKISKNQADTKTKNGWHEESEEIAKPLEPSASPKKPDTTADGWIIDAQ